MKKYLGICLAVVLMGVATGCGGNSKTLTCTKEKKETGMDINETINLDFKKDEITKLEFIQNINVSDGYSSYIKELEESLKSAFASYKDSKGFTLDSSTEGNTIKISLVADFAKMDDNAKENLDIVNTKGKLSDAKKTFESQGYKCK